ncbi:MerR family transcriptional regulator [Streptococcus suis]|uniref:Transcriptional regulator n=1 Tax=Streptococcus suis TaxID=1307 RepID=A0A0Z8FEU6_STRSU|nr:MerR family transcriptional regulator [Streptococcus suis]MCQ8263499.1 MerR family transcriptional regulator [Streptococcus suis]MDW8765266.1 MerR family transcriptional regulator [Streptococcus suis]NQH66109.1 MerR family transcriptional regulator [Streptococcus suis]NQH78654.1 MerR family transcriptional regulator [Streptococcus suis]NQN84956.1 MerR family transcriptional regulator [Streptococcus suis]
MKTVKEVSQLSGISVRTLHYYDEINLLTPSFIAKNGYRYYDNEAFEKLQEILLFRELEFPLKEIKKIVGNAAYDREAALKDQIQLLELKKRHLEKVIQHAKTLQQKGENYMNFEVFDKSDLLAFQEEAKERWGNTAAFQEFSAKTNKEGFAQISSEMSGIMMEFGKMKNLSADDSKVQKQVEVLKAYISENFYNCTNEILASLGQMYIADNRFTQFIDQVGGEGTASFVSQAIAIYCGK